jgi:hypothetical protein
MMRDDSTAAMSLAEQTSDVSRSTARSEARRETRRRMLKAGIIAFNDRYSTLPCTVRDLSSTGARLRVDAVFNVPDTFDLIVELDGLEAPCQVVWRRQNEIGVTFISPPRMVAPKRAQILKALVPELPPTLRRKRLV